MKNTQVRDTARRIIAIVLAVISVLIAHRTVSEAASIQNKDKQPHELTIIGRKGSSVRPIGPNDKLGELCLMGCVLRIGKNPDAEFQIEGSEILSIENGLVYYDGTTQVSPAPPKSK